MICETKTELLNKDWDYEPNVFKASYMGRDVFVTAMNTNSAETQAEKHFKKITKKKIDNEKLFIGQIGKIELTARLKEF